MTTGMSTPSSCLRVLSLNCWQNCAACTPCGPSAGPTGGAGVALPAGTCSLTIALTVFFAIRLYLRGPTALRTGELPFGHRRAPRAVAVPHEDSLSNLLHLEKIHLDRCRPTEYAHHHTKLALLRVDLFDAPREGV